MLKGTRAGRIGITLLTAVTLVGGCSTAGSTPSSGTTVAPASQGASSEWGSIDWQQFKGTTLNVLATEMPVSGVYKPLIADFEALTGIKVNFTLMSDPDRVKAQLVDFSGGTGQYDVSNIGISNREQYAQANYLEPLESYLNDATLTDADWYNLADYPEAILAGGQSKAGAQVYLPFTAEYFLLWYRKDIFDQLGLKPPTTPEELVSTAEKIDQAREAGTITQYAWADRGMPGGGEGGWNFFCMANRLGKTLVDFDSMTSYMAAPDQGEFVMKYYTDLITRFAPPGSANWTWGDISKAFSQEQLAMTVAGNASYTVLEDASTSKVAGRVGYAPPPLAADGKDPLWEWGWGVNASSKNKKAAVLFVLWATSPNLMRQMAPDFGVPARASIYKDPAYLAAMPNEEFVKSQEWMLTNGVDPAPPQLSAKWGEAADLISKEMSSVVAGQKAPDQASLDAESALEKIGYQAAP